MEEPCEHNALPGTKECAEGRPHGEIGPAVGSSEMTKRRNIPHIHQADAGAERDDIQRPRLRTGRGEASRVMRGDDEGAGSDAAETCENARHAEDVLRTLASIYVESARSADTQIFCNNGAYLASLPAGSCGSAHESKAEEAEAERTEGNRAERFRGAPTGGESGCENDDCPPDQVTCLLDLASGWAYGHGLLMFSPSLRSGASPARAAAALAARPALTQAPAGVADDAGEIAYVPSPCSPHCAPFTLLPSPFPLSLCDRARRLAQPFNRLVDRLTCSPRLLLHLLADTIQVDDFTRRLSEIAYRVYVAPARLHDRAARAAAEASSSDARVRGKDGRLCTSLREAHALRGEEGPAAGTCTQTASGGGREDATRQRHSQASAGFGDALEGTERRRGEGDGEEPRRDIAADIRLHIVRSDYMLDRGTDAPGGDTQDPGGGAAEDDGVSITCLNNDRDGAAVQRVCECSYPGGDSGAVGAKGEGGKDAGCARVGATQTAGLLACGGDGGGRAGDNACGVGAGVAPADAIVANEGEAAVGMPGDERAPQRLERPKRTRLAIKQVELNTIAASFGGLATRVSSLHRLTLLAAAALPSYSSPALPSLQGLPARVGEAHARRRCVEKLCPRNWPLEEIAAALATAHYAYVERVTAVEAHDSSAERTSNATSNSYAGDAAAAARVARCAQAGPCACAAGLASSLPPIFLLCVTLEEESNQVDQRLLQTELMSRHGAYMRLISVSELVRLWKRGDLVIAAPAREGDDEDGGGSRDEFTARAAELIGFVSFSNEPDTPAGRLLLLREARGGRPRQRRSSSTHQYSPAQPEAPSAEDSGSRSDATNCDEHEDAGRCQPNFIGVDQDERSVNRGRDEACRHPAAQTEAAVRCSRGNVPGAMCEKEVCAEISVVYYRSMYGPSHYSEDVWKLREFLESSDAVKVPTVLGQLAGAKRTQQLFSDQDKPLHLFPSSLLPAGGRGATRDGPCRACTAARRDADELRLACRAGAPCDCQASRGRSSHTAKGGSQGRACEGEAADPSGDGDVWLLRYLVPDDEVRSDMQRVFQLQVDPSEGLASASARPPSRVISRSASACEADSVELAAPAPPSAEPDCSAPSVARRRRLVLARSAVAAALTAEGRERFLLKPQREGGGNNVHGAAMQTLLRRARKEELKHFVLMRKMEPPALPVLFVRADPGEAAGPRRDADAPRGMAVVHGRRPGDAEGRIVCTFEDGVQELGLFGVMVATGSSPVEDPQREELRQLPSRDGVRFSTNEGADAACPAAELSGAHGGVHTASAVPPRAEGPAPAACCRPSPGAYVELKNAFAGWMLRTKSRRSEEGGVAAGFGALDSPLLLSHALYAKATNEPQTM
ncbi:hypothetical protein BESB_059790 [Besnoitia besnoiti]|uniref:glutathione synthase n=1 Tax=Besnoitia besnoiti TaxID=94643 RepID=A0A2A9MI68_BESBE|nr:hypothetical protein BESB_059790 [Besnoitia besnoiti]PFH35092.1 hypothetical protein BESB_059790 [Besnoitia besnoiti]